MALIDEILNAPTAAIPRQAPPDYPASPDMGGISPVVENAPQSKKPGFFKQMLSNALQGVYDANQAQMGNPDFQRQELALQQQRDASQRAYYDAQMQNWQADNTRAESEFGYSNEMIENPFPIDGNNAKIRRRDLPTALQAYSAWLARKQAEQASDNRLSITEAGKDRRAANRSASGGSKATGVLIPLMDERGELTGKFYNNRTGAVVENPQLAGARKSALPAGENEARAGWQTLMGQFSKLANMPGLKDAVGPVVGRLGQFQAKFLGGNATQADIYQTVSDIKNTIIYLKSGKQINESEFKRLMDALPGENLPYDTFVVRLGNFAKTMQQTFEARTGRPVGASAGGGNDGGTVRVQLPDGRTGSIPKSSMQKYIKAGAKVIN